MDIEPRFVGEWYTLPPDFRHTFQIALTSEHVSSFGCKTDRFGQCQWCRQRSTVVAFLWFWRRRQVSWFTYLLTYLLVVSTCQWALDNRVTHALFFDTPGTVHKLRDQTKLRAGGINSMISSLVGARLPEVTVRTCADDQRRRFALIYVYWAGTSGANSKLLMS